MSDRPVILWFRNDLRLADNPALHAAASTRRPVLPVFIWAPKEEGAWPPGAASKWWLHHSLRELGASLSALGTPLLLRCGPSLRVLESLGAETGAVAVFYNRRYEPAMLERDGLIDRELPKQGIEVQSFDGSLLHEPDAIRNTSGKPFQVFTPFWRRCLETAEPAFPLPAPSALPPLRCPSQSLSLDALALLPRIDWAAEFVQHWTPGEAGAQQRLQSFASRLPAQYEAERDRPDLEGTSRLSPHLHFGEVSPRQVWHACRIAQSTRRNWRQWQFVKELGWREFAHHLLFHFPSTPTQPLRAEFSRFPWRQDAAAFRAWKEGRTGCPLVDAGMRQLWRTGWMHNRVRMVVASFLVKNLLVPWQEGAKWFWDTLIDADLANNTLGWQWSAGCGADAAPFFRVFNPITQGAKFDPEGTYAKRWVSELADIPSAIIHKPAAGENLLTKNGYPEPIVSLFASRVRALDAYARIKQRGP